MLVLCAADPDHSHDDPQAYEAELAAREKALGPNHPDVAESLTNIAILYNQQMNFAKAQPLYERALHIYEQARGPDHADVAHCLTDLAVLHLEQVRCPKFCDKFGCAPPWAYGPKVPRRFNCATS